MTRANELRQRKGSVGGAPAPNGIACMLALRLAALAGSSSPPSAGCERFMFGIWGLGFRVQDSGFGASGFLVQGLGFNV